MPPSTNSKKMGRPTKVASSTGKKKGKRSHSDFTGDDDDYNLFSINDDDSEEELQNPFTLDIDVNPSQNQSTKPKKLNSMNLSPLRSDYMGSPSPKSGLLDQSINQSIHQPNIALSFNTSSPLFDSIINDTINQSTKLSMDHEMLKSLAVELHQMQREAKDRALLVEGELRNMYQSSNQSSKLESQPFYQTAITWVHGIDVADDPLDDSQGSVSRLIEMTKPKQRKRTDQTNNRVNNEEMEEDRPKKVTEKQKIQQLKEWQEEVETYMTFPDESNNLAVKPATIADQPGYNPLGDHWLKAEAEMKWKEERAKEKAKEPEVVESKRKKEKKREKEKRDKERAKEAKKFAEAQRLYLPYYMDPKIRKSVIDMDRELSDKSSSSSLLNRLLACLVEQPAGNVPPPIRPYNVGPISAPSKAKKKKKLERAAMDIDKRIKDELRALGMSVLASVDVESSLHDRVDDQICATIRSAHAERRENAEELNKKRTHFYSIGCQITDHTQRLKGLLEAENQLTKAIKTSKKKKGNDKAVHTAFDGFCQAEKRFGTRRLITGFIPDPREMGGVPREIANSITSHPSYIQVFTENKLPPLGQPISDPYSSFKTSYSPVPMNSMSNSPLPSFVSSTSPLRLPGSPQPGRGDIDAMNDDFGLAISQAEDPFSF